MHETMIPKIQNNKHTLFSIVWIEMCVMFSFLCSCRIWSAAGLTETGSRRAEVTRRKLPFITFSLNAHILHTARYQGEVQGLPMHRIRTHINLLWGVFRCVQFKVALRRMISVWHQSIRIRRLSYRSRGTLMWYTDHSAQRRFKSNTRFILSAATRACFLMWVFGMECKTYGAVYRQSF